MNRIKTESRDAYRNSHSPEQIAERLGDGPRSLYLKDVIYGAIDGAVTTFAVVAGVAGAGLSSGVVIVLGLANLLADGFSMAVSNYLGTRADNQYRRQAEKREWDEIKKWPEGEREEIRQIYAGKGFDGDLLEQVVSVITEDKERWVNTMMQEEHGLSKEAHDPWRAGWSTFAAFFVVGAIPLFTYVWNWLVPESIQSPFLWSCLLTAVAFLLVGLAKGQYIGRRPFVSGLETLAIGGTAAALAYGVGVLLKGLV
ncbi:VIT1/CCC1 transporter family protein [Porticoccaceae bacterium LTM1]|nr:VIT1/CCC1 transporter family protein [Porticoccaceae bacterium LTM1]